MTPATFYVTTPIYYVNDQPHIGHAYTTVLADAIARWHRLLGRDEYFLTGTDEHGQKVEKAAREHGVTPQEHCDQLVLRFKELWRLLEIEPDDFIRTTEPRHTRVVQNVLAFLKDRGEIYLGEYEGWYCVRCERYWTEKDLKEPGRCPDFPEHEVTRLVEQNYYFRMGKHRDWLRSHIQQNPDFIRPESRKNEILGFLDQPLGDLCISRPRERLAWGIEFPFDTKYVTWVWFDALLNYVTALGWDVAKPSDLFRKNWPACHHIIGKDIVTTHAVYWPIMLHAMGLEPPRTILAHGWWVNPAGKKESKSGAERPADPTAFVERYGASAYRYFLLREMSVGQDAAFSDEAFRRRYEADLANDLGNLASRVISMVEKYQGGTLHHPGAAREAEIVPHLGAAGRGVREVAEAIDALPAIIEEELSALRTHAIVERTMALVARANKLVEESQPWKLAKAEGPRDDLALVLYRLACALRAASAALWPVMPSACVELRRRLGVGEEVPRDAKLEFQRDCYPEGGRVRSGPPLFPKEK